MSVRSEGSEQEIYQLGSDGNCRVTVSKSCGLVSYCVTGILGGVDVDRRCRPQPSEEHEVYIIGGEMDVALGELAQEVVIPMTSSSTGDHTQRLPPALVHLVLPEVLS